MKTICLFFFLLIQIAGFGQIPKDFEYTIDTVNCDYKMVYFFFSFPGNQAYDSCCWDFEYAGHYCRNYGMGNSANRNFSQPGTYSVNLQFWKNGVDTNIFKEDIIVVNEAPKPNFMIEYGDSNNFAPQNINFVNKTIMGECSEVSYQWDFGNGEESDEQNPSFYFESPETSYVTLKVTDTLGCDKGYADYVVLRDSAQINEFSFTKYVCGEPTPCDLNLPHVIENPFFLINELERRNDSLFLTGIINMNCCTKNTATMNIVDNKVEINTWQTGPKCTCLDDYYFEIFIPDIISDTIDLSFNGIEVTAVVTSISEEKKDNNLLSLFPNPTNGLLNINVDKSNSIDNYSIFNINGQIVKKGILLYDGGINISDLNEGIYFLQITDNLDRKTVFRFIKE